MFVDRRPRPFVSKLLGKYEIVYRPLRVKGGKERVEVYVESPLDDMKGAWFELLSDRVIENRGYDRAELIYIQKILHDFSDMIYKDAKKAAKKPEDWVSPKFRKGEKVKFIHRGRILRGVIGTVDNYPAFGIEDMGVEYDVWVAKEQCLYKHVKESSLVDAKRRINLPVKKFRKRRCNRF